MLEPESPVTLLTTDGTAIWANVSERLSAGGKNCYIIVFLKTFTNITAVEFCSSGNIQTITLNYKGYSDIFHFCLYRHFKF